MDETVGKIKKKILDEYDLHSYYNYKKVKTIYLFP